MYKKPPHRPTVSEYSRQKKEKVKKMDEKTLKKLQEAKSVEEILAYAKESGITLTEEQAKSIFSRVSGVLSDEDLENVAAGLWPPVEKPGKKYPKLPN